MKKKQDVQAKALPGHTFLVSPTRAGKSVRLDALATRVFHPSGAAEHGADYNPFRLTREEFERVRGKDDNA